MYKRSLFFLIFLLGILKMNAQQYEIGLQIGNTKYIGDIGKEDYFYPSKIGGSLIFKNTVNQWMLMRLSLSYLLIEANDAESYNIGRQTRDWQFSGTVMETSLGIEYNFFPRNPYLRDKKYYKFVPYMYSGLTFINYFGTLNGGNNRENGYEYNGTALGIPMIVGFKYKLSEHFLFSSEIGARYNFTDNLDGTANYFKKIDKYNGVPTTNINSNDWYTFASIGLIYTFGDLRCYFGF